MDLSYIINHLGEDRESHSGSVSPPIYSSSSFSFSSVDDMRQALAREMDVPFYTRGHNPTVATLRKKLAALERTEECIVFGSGSAAIAAAILSALQQGDHIVSVEKPYSWTKKLLSNFLTRFGIETTYVDGLDPENYRKAIQPNTKLLMMESPNSITFELQDIEAIVAIAKENKILTAIDNSYATPLNQQPALMGVDMIIHSATKYLNGHGDIVAGVVCCSRSQAEKIFQNEYMTLGGIISAQDAWLMMRGLRTLPIRMDRVAESTPKIVSYLENQPLVEKVFYPYSPAFPQYELARKQMKKPAGQFSIQIRAENIAQVDMFCNSLQSFLMAPSWGGYESLIFPTSALYTSSNYAETTLPFNLIRFYVGLEDPQYLISDLEKAFQNMAELQYQDT